MSKVIKAIAEHLGVDESKIVPTAHLIDDLDADEFDIVEMTVAMHVIGNCKTALRQVSHYLSEFKFYVVSVASPVPQF